MEGEKRWSSSTFGVGIPPPSEPNCFLSSNWDRNDPFHSALSSLGSSPAASNAGPGAGDGFVIRELFGRLGSMCNSGETSPQSCKIGSSNNTPLNSPPKLNLSETRFRGNFGPSGLAHLNTDRGSVERAAKFSCSGTPEMGYGSLPKLEPGNLSRVSSNNCMNSEKNGDMGDSPEGSSVSEQNPVKELGVKAQSNTNSRKRKAIPKAKAPVKEEKVGKENDESSCAKRSKPDEDTNKDEGNATKDITKNKEAAKPPEPPKDYIHVRARRGQATDSHSLAERVRREKISERMKFLQDLVPGCNKVTGKAVVLDEIINYVQSLQRQVEFLSMKLATVNPRMDVSMEALLSKDILQLQSTVFPIDSASAFPYGFHPQQIPMPPNGLHGGNPAPFSLNPLDQIPSTGLCGDSVSQILSFWEDDLNSIVQMGLAQNHRPSFQSADTTQMKTEL